ncbi:hypothetical protein [Streptomyces sp. NBC_01294]|uniref:hypothetical protein n=1 Tax=Streptomyces sp. NBC_01294 TaxID=2903815 RepID=UPI002DD8A1E6|nr:hypothetical protein [Streptomyces sp. NBC_01294]WRZ56219.1 hypothetical protein OG534_06905 [Streptomyces sp. NBC_01294]
MPDSGDDKTADPGAGLRHDDPRGAGAGAGAGVGAGAGGPGGGRRPRPRWYHRTRAWLAMGLGVGAAVAGATLPNGLLMAAGLVVAALAVNLFGTPQRRRRTRGAKPG